MKKKSVLIISIIVLLLIGGGLLWFCTRDKEVQLKDGYMKYNIIINDKVSLNKKVKAGDKVDIYIKSNDLLSEEEQNVAFVENVAVYDYYDTNEKYVSLAIYDNDVYSLLSSMNNDKVNMEIKKHNSKKDEQVNTKIKEKLMETYKTVSGE